MIERDKKHESAKETRVGTGQSYPSLGQGEERGYWFEEKRSRLEVVGDAGDVAHPRLVTLNELESFPLGGLAQVSEGWDGERALCLGCWITTTASHASTRYV